MVPTYNIMREKIMLRILFRRVWSILKVYRKLELGTLASHCLKLLYSVSGWSVFLFAAPKAFLAFSRTLRFEAILSTPRSSDGVTDALCVIRFKAHCICLK